MHAAREGHEQAVRELLNGNANVNRRGRDGDTALSVAVAHEPRLIKVLLKAGADLDSRNRAFEAAARVSNPDLFPVLMKAGLSRDVVARALFAASGSATLALDRRRDETVKSLIDLGAEVNGKNEKGQTPMLLAAERGHLSVIKILLNRGAAIDAGCDCPTSEGAGWTPLMVAIVDGHDEVAEFLMEKGADMNRKNQATGETALELAANKADAETISIPVKERCRRKCP
jgi:ankyrin repeat protein